MFWFICALILFLVGIAIFFVNPQAEVDDKSKPNTSPYSGRDYDPKSVSLRWVAVFPVLLGLLFLLLSTITTVGPRAVGVPTVFGRTTGDTYGPGLHFKAPWVGVTDIDGSIQPEEYKGDDCITVKIADGGTACATLAYRWRINSDQGDEAYKDYNKSEDDITTAIRKAIVSTNVKAAVNEVFGQWDPLDGAELSADMTPQQLANAKVNVVPDYDQFNQDIQDNVEKKIADLGGLIDVESVTVSYVSLPEATQDRINAFNTAVQNTKIALQEVATKDAQAEGNRRLAASLKDPNVLISKCLDGLISGEIENQPGFSCSLGGGSAVVLPGTK